MAARHTRRGAKWMAGALGVALALSVAACSIVEVRYADGHTERMRRAEFKKYAERVFRRQNRVVDQLIRIDERNIAEGGEADPRLARAEESMEDACRPLIKLVSAKAEGLKMKLADKLDMPSAAPACDSAVKGVEQLLPADAAR